MKFLKLLLISILIPLGACVPQVVFADSVSDNGLTFLRSKQDTSGKITGGYSVPSQWSAIALTIHGIDTAAVKNSSTSLKDFLLSDIPSNGAATDWENRILALVAIGENPGNSNGVNYVQQLESFINNGQIGDTCALNDDIFGLLAFVASGDLVTTQKKQDALQFLITNQDADGGFSWSAPGCSWYATSADMTGAAIQAMQAAKEQGITHAELDNAITKAKNYVLTHQNSDGGFGSFGSDADTTSWALMGLNVVGLQDSQQANTAKNWLRSMQQSDGGFLSWGGSDSTTTAQSLIALAGKGWILHVYTGPAISGNTTTIPSVTPTPTAVITPTPTSVPGLISMTQYITVTVTPQPTNTTKRSTTRSDQKKSVLGAATEDNKEKEIPTPTVTAQQEIQKTIIQSFGMRNIVFFVSAGICLVLATLWIGMRLRGKL